MYLMILNDVLHIFNTLVQRTAGGGAALKKSKITSYREEQTTYISQTMDHILSEYIKKGDIDEDELDEGVIALCKRHSATVVERALNEYVDEKKVRKERKETLGEKEEEELRNPSAFLTHMIGRIAEEGLDPNESKRTTSSSGGKGRGDRGRGGGPGRGSGGRGSGRGNDRKGDSEFEKQGVDMSISRGGGSGLSQMFP